MASQIANNWKELLAYGTPDYSNDAFNIILMQSGFSFSRSAHEEYADVSAFELPTAYGYTTGGIVLAGVTVTNDPVTASAQIEWNNVSWVAAGGNIQAAGAIIYDDTIAAPDTDPIVGYIDFLSTLTTYNGGTFTVANILVSHT